MSAEFEQLINELEGSFSANKPKALVQMATGADKAFIAITVAYRLLKFGKMSRILFLVDTGSLDEQAEEEFYEYEASGERLHRWLTSFNFLKANGN